ncbi:MAG: hypothetical protein Q9162_002391 [Coniocarpon cinnabarinum]
MNSAPVIYPDVSVKLKFLSTTDQAWIYEVEEARIESRHEGYPVPTLPKEGDKIEVPTKKGHQAHLDSSEGPDVEGSPD